MKKIDTYILEKFKINKETSLEDDQFKIYYTLFDEAFEKAGFKKDDGIYERVDFLNSENRTVQIINNLIFKGNKAKDNFTPKLALKFNLFISTVDGKEETLIDCRLLYSNGKKSFSVNSNINRSLKYIFDYRKKTKLINHGNTFGYIANDKLVKAITDGIKSLRYYNYEFDEAIKKARFTDSQWNKLIDLCMDIFGSETK